MVRVTEDAADELAPRVTREGRRVVFSSTRNGNYDVFMKDLASGAERQLTSSPEDEMFPVLSPDGSEVAYRSGREVWVANVRSGSLRRGCTNCGQIQELAVRQFSGDSAGHR